MDYNEHIALEQHKNRQLQARQRILSNPEQFPPQSVAAARQAQAQYEHEEGLTTGQQVGTAVENITTAFAERPGETVAELLNSITADLLLMFTPMGVGAKPFQAIHTAARAKPLAQGTAAARRVEVADDIADAAITGGTASLAAEQIIAFDQHREMTEGEQIASFGVGALGAGGVNAIGQIFTRSRAAKDTLKAITGGHKPSPDSKIGGLTFDELTADLTNEVKVVEEVLATPERFDSAIVNQINDIVGIKPEMDARERGLSRLRYKKEIQEMFAEAEKARVATQIAENPPEAPDARRTRFSEEFEKAVAARAAQPDLGRDARITADADIAQKASKLDEEDIIVSAFESTSAVRQAMERARRRDSRLANPKWQDGSVSPELLTRLGAAALFGTAAYGLVEGEAETGAAFAAGLAGLFLPGGGSVKNIMRQTGATSFDGSLIPAVAFKRRSDKIAEAEGAAPKTVSQVMEDDFNTIQRALGGDQAAHKKLYEDYMPAVTAVVKKMGSKIAPRLGMDVSDMAQEIALSIFQSLPNYKPVAPFGAFVNTIAKNKVKDYLDTVNAKKRKDAFKEDSIFSAPGRDLPGSAGAGHIMEGNTSMYNKLVEEEPAGTDWSTSYTTTPESAAIRDQAVSIIQNTLDRMNPRMRNSFTEHHELGMSPQEIADRSNQSVKTVYDQITAAEKLLSDAVGKGLNARKRVEVPVGDVPASRGRGRPRKQAGMIDRELAKTLAKVGIGAAGGAAVGTLLNDQNGVFGLDVPMELWGAALGVGAVLATRGKTPKGKTLTRSLIDGVDYTIGVTSTQIKNISEKVWKRAVNFESAVLKNTHRHIVKITPFARVFNKLPKESQDVLTRAILTGRKDVTDRILEAIGDKDLTEGWRQVRGVLDDIKKDLVEVNRIIPGDFEYYPRIVVNVEGLLTAIGAKSEHPLRVALAEANKKSITSAGRPLTEAEESLIISRYLAGYGEFSNQPGFAKNRGVEEITPELQEFYASPIESLNSYVRTAVEDIETAKFFGKDIITTADGKKVYTNVGESIGQLVRKEMDNGMKDEDVNKLRELLRIRFLEGNKVPHWSVRAYRDLNYIGLLGQVDSAIVQFGDVPLQIKMQGLMPTLEAIVRSLTNRKLVDMKDFGLQDHITAELLGKGVTTKFLDRVFKLSGFTQIDQFGKNVALNAAVINAAKKTKTEKGIKELQDKWGEALQPGEMKQLINDLQKGEMSDIVMDMAFAELSRTQPVSRLELPPAYLNNPNGRILYSLKSFTIKQLDLARREGWNEIKKGDAKSIARGAKNLFDIALIMGLAGASTGMVRDFLLNREVDFEATDITDNILKVYGMSQFFMDRALGVSKEDARIRRAEGDIYARAQESDIGQAALGLIAPPYKMYSEFVRADPDFSKYFPVIGRMYHAHTKEPEVTHR